MDSTNSGSLQSSSGGDEEYDSRPDSLSAAFFHPSSSPAGGAATALRRPPPPSSSSSSPPFLDSLSYLDPFPRSPNPGLLPLDAAGAVAPWRARLPAFPPSSAAEVDHAHAAAAAARAGSVGIGIGPSPESNPAPAGGGGAAAATTPRGSRKRSRASRRAPTTVLTTDTSNFRAMVQEFTGIPSPPFAAAAAAAAFPRSGRFDLFHTAASALRSSSDPPQPHYLLRPFAQKLQSPTFPSPVSSFSPPAATLVDAGIASTANANSSSCSIPMTRVLVSSANPNASNSNYQLPPPHDLGLGSQSQSPNDLLHLQSPLLTFQSLLQSHKYSLPTTTPAFSARPAMPSAGSGVLFGLPPGLVGSEGSLHSRGELAAGWADGSSAAAAVEGAVVGDGAQLRPVSVTNFPAGSHQRLSSCKLNYSVASGPSEFNGEKGSTESASAARTEGMVDSWLCSSD